MSSSTRASILPRVCASIACCALLMVCGARAQSLAPADESRSTGAADSSTGTSSSVSAELPDAPQSNVRHQDVQTKRILGIIPNFRAVSADVKLPPQSVRDKFLTTTQDSFDYSAVFLPAALAGYSELVDSTPEFHKGGAGYGRYFWHNYVDQIDENYWVEFIVPSLTREDNRYYTLGRGGFLNRTKYSLTRVFITRSDSGKEVFNAGEIVGAGIASGVSNLYYPAPERTVSNTLGKWGQNVGIDAATFMFKEFWPDINRRVFHNQADTPNVPYKP